MNARRQQAVEILERTYRELEPTWRAYRSELRRQRRDGRRIDLSPLAIGDAVDMRFYGSRDLYYYERVERVIDFVEHGPPDVRADRYTVGYHFWLVEQAVSRSGLRRQATTVREASVCVFVQWSGTPELWTKPKSYPATPDGWQRMITDGGWQP
jgi:hypothetical protein